MFALIHPTSGYLVHNASLAVRFRAGEDAETEHHGTPPANAVLFQDAEGAQFVADLLSRHFVAENLAVAEVDGVAETTPTVITDAVIGHIRSKTGYEGGFKATFERQGAEPGSGS